MYWEFFGFKEPPFALTPNPAFLFLSTPHQEAFAHLLFAIENKAGFIELSGEVGTGKTTVVRTLLNQLDPENYRTALIFNPTLSPLGLLRELNGEFGLAAGGSDLQELHQALNAFLLEENRAGRTVVLVIDEAQNLTVEVLEQIRLISNLETDRSKLIQIVLVGQPELRDLLARPELRQLNQRITVRYHLKPMDFADSCDYVRHRIRFAAGGGEPLTFSNGALNRIYTFSGGLPRLINSACDRALLLSYTRGSREVTPVMAKECLADLSRELPRPGKVWPKALAALGGVALLLAAAWLALPGRGPEQTAKASAPAPQLPGSAGPVVPAPSDGSLPARAGSPATKATTTGPATTAFSLDAAQRDLAANSQGDNLRLSLNAILASWRSPLLSGWVGQGTNLQALARQRGMLATRVGGGLEELARLDLPALLQIDLPGNGGSRYLALTSVDRDQVTVSPPLAGRSSLSRAELEQVWKGGATLLWKDFLGLSSRMRPAERGNGVRQLQGLLRGVGCYQGPLNGAMGPMTVEAVNEFQRRERLPVDGKAKGLTLMMLYRRAGGFFPPPLVRERGGNAGALEPAIDGEKGRQS